MPYIVESSRDGIPVEVVLQVVIFFSWLQVSTVEEDNPELIQIFCSFSRDRETQSGMTNPTIATIDSLSSIWIFFTRYYCTRIETIYHLTYYDIAMFGIPIREIFSCRNFLLLILSSRDFLLGNHFIGINHFLIKYSSYSGYLIGIVFNLFYYILSRYCLYARFLFGKHSHDGIF